MDKATLTIEDRDWRFKRVRKMMSAKGIDALFVSADSVAEGPVRYFVGEFFKVGYGFAFVLFTHEKCILFSGVEGRSYMARNYEDYIKEPWTDELRNISAPAFIKALKELGLESKKIGLNETFFPAKVLNGLKQETPHAVFTDITMDFQALRRTKTEREIDILQACTDICEDIWNFNKTFIKPGMLDYKITAEWDYRMLANHANNTFNLMQNNPYDATVPCWPSYHPPKAVKVGDTILTEITCVLHGYWTQRVACYSMGDPKPIMQELFEANKLAQEEAAKMIKPGVAAADVARLIDQVINNAGFLNPGQFHTGPRAHHCGLEVDEGTLSPEADFILGENEVIVIHPGAAVKDWSMGKPGMFGPGNMYRITKDGCVRMSKLPAEFTVIEC